MKKGDIVLIKYPFSDLIGNKVRPALVISSEQYNRTSQDALFIAISSVIDSPRSVDLLISSTHVDFSRTGLHVASLVKTDKIFCLLQSSTARFLGDVSVSMQKEIDSRLRDLLGLPLS